MANGQLAGRIRNRIAWEWRRRRFRPYALSRQLAQTDVRVWVGDTIAEDWYGSGHQTWPELEWIRRFGIRLGDIVLDCGANIGVTSVLFAQWTGPDGRVHAFDPVPSNVDQIRRNVLLNGLSNVVVHPVALGNENGVVRITEHTNSSILGSGQHAKDEREAQALRLDDAIPHQRVGFMKIDVEGWELAVLRGAEEITRDCRCIDVELHVGMYHNRKCELSEIFDRLQVARDRAWIQLSVDGLIEPYAATKHNLELLTSAEVVHLFLDRS